MPINLKTILVFVRNNKTNKFSNLLCICEIYSVTFRGLCWPLVFELRLLLGAPIAFKPKSFLRFAHLLKWLLQSAKHQTLMFVFAFGVCVRILVRQSLVYPRAYQRTPRCT